MQGQLCLVAGTGEERDTPLVEVIPVRRRAADRDAVPVHEAAGIVDGEHQDQPAAGSELRCLRRGHETDDLKQAPTPYSPRTTRYSPRTRWRCESPRAPAACGEGHPASNSRSHWD